MHLMDWQHMIVFSIKTITFIYYVEVENRSSDNRLRKNIKEVFLINKYMSPNVTLDIFWFYQLLYNKQHNIYRVLHKLPWPKSITNSFSNNWGTLFSRPPLISSTATKVRSTKIKIKFTYFQEQQNLHIRMKINYICQLSMF